jgi:pteridine reductase
LNHFILGSSEGYNSLDTLAGTPVPSIICWHIGDWATDRPYKDYLPYLVAKGGLTTMTLALARELAPHIPVAMIQPAMIDPPPDFDEEQKRAVLAQTPLERFGSAGDVNRLILYLLEGTNFVTGACFRVDGGRFLGGATATD